MNQSTISIFSGKKLSKPPKKFYSTNKTNDNHIDDTWSIKILELNECRPEIFRRNRFVLNVSNNSSKFGWAVPLKKGFSKSNTLF